MPLLLHQNGSLSYRQASVNGEVSARRGRSHHRSLDSFQPKTSVARMAPLPSVIGSLEAILLHGAVRKFPISKAVSCSTWAAERKSFSARTVSRSSIKLT